MVNVTSATNAAALTFTRTAAPQAATLHKDVPVQAFVAPELEPAMAAALDERGPVVVQHENIQASFEYDQQLKQIIIKLSRNDTGEVVQQIPSEKVQHLVASLMEVLGQMVDVRG